MVNTLKIAQIIIGLILVILVLMQSKGSGLSMDVKTSLSSYRSLRGVEKSVFVFTIVFGALLVISSALIVALS